MSTRSVTVLGAVCLVLALFCLWFELPAPAAAVRKEERLFALSRDDVSGIDIRSAAPVSLVKKGKTWWVGGDMELLADQGEAAALVKNLLSLAVEASAARGTDDFGLGQGALEVGVRTSRGVYRLRLGDESPTSAYCYASVPWRSGVLLLPAGSRDLFGKSLFSLTDKHVVDVAPGDVSRVRVIKHGNILEFIRNGQGRWQLTGAGGAKLGTDKVNDFFGFVCGMQALSFPENQKVPAGIDATVDLWSPRGVRKVRIWREGQRVFAVSDYQRMKSEINPRVLPEIPAGPDPLLDKSILPIPGDMVRQLALRGKDGQVFTLRDGEWYTGTRKVGSRDALDLFLQTLISLEYEDQYLVLPREAGAGVGMRAFPEGGTAPFDIMLYSQYYVAVGKNVYRINEGDMNNLKESLQALISEYQ